MLLYAALYPPHIGWHPPKRMIRLVPTASTTPFYFHPPVPPPLTPLPSHCAARHASTAAAHSDPTAERIADYADQPADTAADYADEHAKSSTGRANCPRDHVNEDYQQCTGD